MKKSSLCQTITALKGGDNLSDVGKSVGIGKVSWYWKVGI